MELRPEYLQDCSSPDIKTELFWSYLRCTIWNCPNWATGFIRPNAPEILAKAAFEHNIPYTLSTVSTSNIERICKLTEGQAWFQLYHPTENRLRDDIINRAEAAGCKVLILLCDTITFGFRPKDIRNGLAMPPKMSLANFVQIAGKPTWTLKTLRHGQPNFETLKPLYAQRTRSQKTW